MQRRMLLRSLTTRLARIRGGARLMDPLLSRLDPRVEVITDFRGDLSMELDTAHLIASEIFWYGAYNRVMLPVLERLLRSGDRVVDAGANIGEIALAAARVVGPSGRVLAFEPHPGIAEVLERNARRNGFAQLQVLREALSDRPGTLTLYESSEAYRNRHNEGLGTLYPTSTRAVVVGEAPLIRLDDVLAREGVDRIDLLKIDVEGSELPVLKGAATCIGRDRPWIVVEVQDQSAQAAGYRAEDILSFLEGFDYRFASFQRKALVPLTRASLEPFQNVLAVPPGREVPA